MFDPDEYLNGDPKRGVHTGLPPRAAADLKRQTLAQLRSIQRSPSRVRGYFVCYHTTSERDSRARALGVCK